MNTMPSHLPEFKDWVVTQERKATGTAAIYANQLKRCAKFYGTPIDERTVRIEADVQRIAKRVGKVFTQRGRWTKGTLNEHDITDNLIPALRAYARFTTARFTVPKDGKAPAVTTARDGFGAQKKPRAEAKLEGTAVDVPATGVPERMMTEISRIVRNTSLVREIKALHRHRCQVCGKTLELLPGILYSEGHHLKPLGTPHNGPDVKENVLCVCPTCHVKLDFAAQRIDNGSIRVADGHSIGQEFIEYHNSLYESGTTSYGKKMA